MQDSMAMDLYASDVLVIEDDDGARTAIRRTLGSARYLVTGVEDGSLGLAQLKRHPFAVVVTDIRMPVMNGLEFYQQLSEAYPDMARRVVFVTAHLADDDIGVFLDRVGQPVLRKPFETQELVAAVRRLIGGSDQVLMGE